IFINIGLIILFFFFSSRRRHTRSKRDWSSDVCSSDLIEFSSFPPTIYLKSLESQGKCDKHFPSNYQQFFLLLLENQQKHLPQIRSEERRVGKESIYLWSNAE